MEDGGILEVQLMETSTHTVRGRGMKKNWKNYEKYGEPQNPRKK